MNRKQAIKPDALKKTAWIAVKVTEQDKQTIQRAAVSSSLDYSAWVRMILLQAAQRILKHA